MNVEKTGSGTGTSKNKLKSYSTEVSRICNEYEKKENQIDATEQEVKRTDIVKILSLGTFMDVFVCFWH